ncbi:hypothetical protein ACJ6WF_15865 [Streptomyces sp. MMS24-I2-30]|uniref:hypothetical protein n=1 Tax=Streptomyces sp. MMS24-I2-30 TaxID=3351564 RepID=UPI003896D753
MNSEAPAGEVSVDARPWLPGLNDTLIDDLPSLDDPTLRPAVTALLTTSGAPSAPWRAVREAEPDVTPGHHRLSPACSTALGSAGDSAPAARELPAAEYSRRLLLLRICWSGAARSPTGPAGSRRPRPPGTCWPGPSARPRTGYAG